MSVKIKTKHEALLVAALDVLSSVSKDTSVSPETIIESLDEIIERAKEYRACLLEQVERMRRKD